MSRPAGVATKSGQTFTCLCGDLGEEWFSSHPLVGLVWLHADDNTPRCLTPSEAEARRASCTASEDWAFQ